MCGILGYLHNRELNYSLEEFSQIVDKMSKRGPNSSGVIQFPFQENFLKLGHRRLAILDLEDTGNQPMVSHSKRFAIIYNGEIYNHRELRANFFSEDMSLWKGSSDTETILEIVEKEGLYKVLPKLEGMFAFCLIDKKENLIHLVRDRVGEKPLYISTGKGFFGFCSDLNPLKALPRFKRNLDQYAVGKFLQLNYIPSPLTIFKGSFKLLPGTCITVDLKKFIPREFKSFDEFISEPSVTIKEWWSIKDLYLTKRNTTDMSEQEVLHKTENLLLNSVSRQMISDVPLGAFLSGGIDSSLIVSLMQKVHSNTQTFNVGFDFDDFDESYYAKQIASHLGTQHTSYTCTKEDAFNLIPNLTETFSEPFADSSQIPTMLVSKMAREKVTVALSGDAGDELFGGYNRYLLANKYWKYINFLPQKLRTSLISLISYLPYKQSLYLLSLTPFFKDLSGSIEERLNKIIKKSYSITDKSSYYHSMTTEWSADSGIMEKNYFLETDRFNKLFSDDSKLSFEEAMMHADFVTYLPDDILCKVDRSSMHFSLETRAPYLSKDLIEFAYSLPLQYKIRNGVSKWVLKEILSNYVPEHLFLRPKQGFGLPISKWMRQDLKDWTNDLLSESVLRKHGLFNESLVASAKEEHFKGLNNEHKLWSIAQFNQWYLSNY